MAMKQLHFNFVKIYYAKNILHLHHKYTEKESIRFHTHFPVFHFYLSCYYVFDKT